MNKLKRYFYFFIHLNFITGFSYALYHFLNTPRSVFLHRRLWAYESWIIISFYCLFIFLILWEKEVRVKEELIVLANHNSLPTSPQARKSEGACGC